MDRKVFDSEAEEAHVSAKLIKTAHNNTNIFFMLHTFFDKFWQIFHEF